MGDAAELTTRCIARQRRIVCAAPSYLDRRGAPQTIGDISRHSSVAYGRSGAAWHWRLPDAQGRAVEIEPSTRFRLNDLQAVADAAIAGMGLAWLPVWLVTRELETGALVELFDDHPRLSFETHAVWPHTTQLPVRVRLAIDALAHQLPAMCER